MNDPYNPGPEGFSYVAPGVEEVKRGYSEMTRSLNFRVPFTNFRDAARAIRAIGSYNYFDGDAVAEVLEPSMLAGIEVGREGSPVLYFHFHMGTTVADRLSLMHELRLVHADEVDYDEAEHKIRAWWD